MDKEYGVLCRERKYLTRWTEAQCRAYLSRKNVYDSFLYDFKDGCPAIISFRERSKGRLFDGRRLHAEYRIFFEKGEDDTVMIVEFSAKGIFAMELADLDLDEFFRVKLDAIPC